MLRVRVINVPDTNSFVCTGYRGHRWKRNTDIIIRQQKAMKRKGNKKGNEDPEGKSERTSSARNENIIGGGE
jgi:hypothetical protein